MKHLPRSFKSIVGVKSVCRLVEAVFDDILDVRVVLGDVFNIRFGDLIVVGFADIIGGCVILGGIIDVGALSGDFIGLVFGEVLDVGVVVRVVLGDVIGVGFGDVVGVVVRVELLDEYPLLESVSFLLDSFFALFSLFGECCV